MSVAIFSDGRGGKMYVPRAAYSLSRSFWTVPESALHAIPRSRATERRSARRMAAVELIVIDIDTRSSGRPSVRRRMSSMVAIATPALPTSPRASGSSES
jgi:hypothetical protein